MFRIAYSPPLLARVTDSMSHTLQARAGVQTLAQMRNATSLPRRISNYAEYARAWIPRAPSRSISSPVPRTTTQPSPAASPPPVSSLATTRCAFTGIAIRNGRLDPVQARAFIADTGGVRVRRTAPTQAARIAHVPSIRLSVGVMAGTVTAGAAAATQTAHVSAPALPGGVSASVAPAPMRAESIGDIALKQVSAIRLLWQSGYFEAQANKAHGGRTSDAAVNRIREEIAQARNSGS